jgi:GAF domain-containing protein
MTLSHRITAVSAGDKPAFYAAMQAELRAIFAGEDDAIANMANCAAMLFWNLPRLNWAGFYLFKKGELVLGPFQGKPACIRIALGRGVCGTAAAGKRTLVVPDVHCFPGHIACDAQSQSEIVVPLLAGDRLLGVMDLDSPDVRCFDAADAAGLEAVAKILVESSCYSAT